MRLEEADKKFFVGARIRTNINPDRTGIVVHSSTLPGHKHNWITTAKRTRNGVVEIGTYVYVCIAWDDSTYGDTDDTNCGGFAVEALSVIEEEFQEKSMASYVIEAIKAGDFTLGELSEIYRESTIALMNRKA